MREILIILNYQREIPPFMLSQIKYAEKYFKEIVYITRNLINDNSSMCEARNFRIVQAGSAKSMPHLISALLCGAAKDTMISAIRAAKAKRLSLSFLKSEMADEIGSYLLFLEATKTISKYGDHRCVVLATWFMTEAYAAVLLKRKFKMLKVASFAHSFEVQREKDHSLDLRHIRERHNELDIIFFISNRVLENYRREFMIPLGIPDNNVRVHYLGTEAGRNGRGPSRDELVRIVSCSGIIPVKRVDLLINSLSIAGSQTSVKIHWTHIGSGPLEKDAKDLAASKLADCIIYDFKGYIPNYAVRNYFESNPCDLFINVSSMEGLPVSIMECMSYGVPALATDVGGSGDIVINGKTGLLVSANPTAEEVAEAIRRFIELDSENKQEMRTLCRKLWEDYFDVSKNAPTLYSQLRNIDNVC